MFKIVVFMALIGVVCIAGTVIPSTQISKASSVVASGSPLDNAVEILEGAEYGYGHYYNPLYSHYNNHHHHHHDDHDHHYDHHHHYDDHHHHYDDHHHHYDDHHHHYNDHGHHHHHHG